MLKSRRSGLLAAGLAVAVVGGLGVVWTLNAGAAQISGDPDASPVAVQADADTGDVGTPPPTLPWGAKPVRARRGAVGTTSRQLHDEGLQAATGESTRHLDFAPKGTITPNGVLRSEQTDIQPPEPAPAVSDGTGTPAADQPAPTDQPTPDTGPAALSAADTPTATPPVTGQTTRPAPVNPVVAAKSSPPATGGGDTGKVKFLYSGGQYTATADGIYVAMDVRRPVVASGDYHSLAEVAVQSTPDDKQPQQTVEVGWTVDRAVNGDSDPHLFVFHWVKGKPTCYNACGFVPNNAGINAGDTLPLDTTKKFGIQHRNGGWWIAVDTVWVGHFPDQIWSDQNVTFTSGGFFQAFGEVASVSTVPCSQMGNGQIAFATTTNAARIGSITFINGTLSDQQVLNTTSQYGFAPISSRSFYYGGPGAVSTPPPSTPSPSTPASSAPPTPPDPPYNPNC